MKAVGRWCRKLRPYGLAVSTILGAAGAGVVLHTCLQPENPGQISGPLLLLGVLVVAWFGTWMAGLFAAGLASILFEYYFLPPLQALDFGVDDLSRWSVYILLILLVATVKERRQRAEAFRLGTERDLQAARITQQRLFPEAVSFPGLDAAGACLPAHTTGGDYYDFVPMRDGATGVVVADVSGHGLDSALVMMEIRAYLRALVLTHDDVGEILTLMNRLFTAEWEGDRFCTLFFARLDPQARLLRYAGAGHEAYLLDPQAGLRRLENTGLPLGVMEDASIACSPPIPFPSGQLLLVVTDGVLEAASPAGALFGRERMLAALRHYPRRTMRELVQTLVRAIWDFSGRAPTDDVTVVLVRSSPDS